MRRRIANRLRYSFGHSLFPPRAGSGLVPWISGRGLRTSLLFNPLREPSVRVPNLATKVIQFDAGGRQLRTLQLEIPSNSVFRLDLPEELGSDWAYGYCWIWGLGKGEILLPLQVYFHISGKGSFGKTHGRAKGAVMFGRRSLMERIISLLDPMPYRADTVQVPESHVRHAFLLMNVSDRPAVVRPEYDGETAQLIKLPAHGSKLLFSERPAAHFVDFRASAPFTFYNVLTKPDGSGLAIQHIQDRF